MKVVFLGATKGMGRALARPIAPEALRLCARYAWPGNVRELRAEVQRWTVFCEGEVDPDALSIEIRAPARRSQRTPAAPDEPPAAAVEPLAESLARVERAALQAALEATGRNLVQAARALGIDRNTLKRKLRGHGLYPLRSPSSRSSRRR